MMKKSLSALLFFGFALGGSADEIKQAIHLDDHQETVRVSLPANSTTGYQWYLQGYDHDLLSLQDYRYVKSSSHARVGSGGTAVFLFNIDPQFYDGPQITHLDFVYQQAGNPVGTNTASVALFATANSNDTDNWQKYPSLEEQEVSPHLNSDSAHSASNWLSLPAALPPLNS